MKKSFKKKLKEISASYLLRTFSGLVGVCECEHKNILKCIEVNERKYQLIMKKKKYVSWLQNFTAHMQNGKNRLI